MITNDDIARAMTIRLDRVVESLPSMPEFAEGIRRAPKRRFTLNRDETILALKNALRYIPPQWQEKLAPEFLDELISTGRIYGYRFRPPGRIKGQPIDSYPGNCIEGRACQVMIDNNLDFDVALYPYELVTYGETGQVCQNWMQYRLFQRLGLTDYRHHEPVMVRILLMVEELHLLPAAKRGEYLLYLSFVPPLAEVGHALHYLLHMSPLKIGSTE